MGETFSKPCMPPPCKLPCKAYAEFEVSPASRVVAEPEKYATECGWLSAEVVRDPFAVNPTVPSVPYECRALTLDQLHLMNTAFVENGWLEDQCRTYNERERDNIEVGKVYSYPPNLYAMCRFVVSPLTDPLRWADIPWELRRLVALSAKPTRTCCYAELVNPRGCSVDVFVSHFWGHPFRRTLTALNALAPSRLPANPGMVGFWICLFALDQHTAALEVGASPETGPFNSAIEKNECFIAMVIDESVTPLSRVWCLFEVHRAHVLNKPLALIDEHGSIAESADLHTLKNILNGLDSVSAFTANASVKSDKNQIWHCIADAWVRRTCPTFAGFLRHTEKKPLKQKHFATFDSQVGKLLCEPLLQAAINQHDTQTMLRCVGLGAGVKADALHVLKDHGVDLTSQLVLARFAVQPQSLASVMAYFGNVDGLQLLQEVGADLQNQDMDGWMPGHFAARLGHHGVVEFLIRAGVDFQIGNKDGRAPAHFAAQNGHDDIISLFFSAGFSIGATDKYGDSAAHVAAQNGRQNVLELLLDIGVDLQHRDAYGWTPAHFAAESGHARVVEFLCEQSCAVDLRAEIEAHFQRVQQELHVSELPRLLNSASQFARCDCVLTKSASEDSLGKKG